jgi:hypothetical protein
MRGLFDPVVDSVIRLVDQQVKTAKNVEDADIHVSELPRLKESFAHQNGQCLSHALSTFF